jgi:5-(carboxyamino)imidazole ribonucleotide mutase
VATVAIGKAGAVNAGLLAAQILGTVDTAAATALEERRERTHDEVLKSTGDLI